MKKNRRYMPAKLILIVLLAAASICSCRKEDNADKTTVFQSELRSVQKLILSRMTVTKMATIDDIRLSEAKGARQITSALIDAIKPGTRKAAYSYDTHLYAYVDLSALGPDDFRQTAPDAIEISLPPIEITYEGRDLEIREEHYRVTGMRSQISASERAQLKEEMNRILKQEIADDPEYAESLRREARMKLDSYFAAFARNHGIKVKLIYAPGTPDLPGVPNPGYFNGTESPSTHITTGTPNG